MLVGTVYSREHWKVTSLFTEKGYGFCWGNVKLQIVSTGGQITYTAWSAQLAFLFKYVRLQLRHNQMQCYALKNDDNVGHIVRLEGLCSRQCWLWKRFLVMLGNQPTLNLLWKAPAVRARVEKKELSFGNWEIILLVCVALVKLQLLRFLNEFINLKKPL